MSSSTWTDRVKMRKPPEERASPQTRKGWVGFDFAGDRSPRRTRALVPLLLVALMTALGVAALRIDLIRTRYAVAASMKAESRLIDEQRALIARKRSLRDPMALAIEARDRGFRPPAHVYSIPDPNQNAAPLPQVASGPSSAERP